MGSGCESLIAGKIPSSARQLPILAALHAKVSTLFGHIIHHGEQKVNTFLKIIDNFLSKRKTIPRGEGGFKFGHVWTNLKTGEEWRQNRYRNMSIHSW